MRLRKVNFVLLLLFLIVPVGLAGWWTLGEIHRQVRTDVVDTLETLLAATHYSLRLWVTDTRSNMTSWAEARGVAPNVKALQAARRRGISLEGLPQQYALRVSLQPVLARRDYIDFVVIDRDHVQIASSADGMIGRKEVSTIDPRTIDAAFAGRPQLGLPLKVDQGASGGYLPLSSMLMVGAVPIHDGGKVIAVLAFLLDPTGDMSRLAQLGRVWQTGETYAFNREGKMITQSRFDRHLRQIGLLPAGESSQLAIDLRDPGGNLVTGYKTSVPRAQQPLDRMAADAIKGGSGVDVDGYRDYRGVPVVGAWLWDPELGFGLATEIDKAEAYRTYDLTRTLTLLLIVVALTLSVVIASTLFRYSTDLEKSFSRETAAKSEIQRALHIRDDFLSIASHELKTPITSLKLQMGMIRRIVEKSQDLAPRLPSLTRVARSAEEQVDRLSGLINDLLDVTRISAGRMPLRTEMVNLRNLVADVVERFSMELEQAACPVDLHLQEVIGSWDPYRTEQVIVNLLTNAMKYGRGKRIEIEVSRWDDTARISVRDHGPGIDFKDQARIFERYERAVSPRLAIGGLGLGLFISRSIVEAQGGTIRVESGKGVGSNFIVELPIRYPGRLPGRGARSGSAGQAAPGSAA